MEKWSNPRMNIPAILIAALISLFAVSNADYSNGKGMALLFVIWLPIIAAAISFLLFLVLFKYFPKVAWVPTVLGVAFMLLLAFSTTR